MSAPKDPTHPKAFDADEHSRRLEQDDVEGHGGRRAGLTDDTEPNGDVDGAGRASKKSDDSDDVEGHAGRVKF